MTRLSSQDPGRNAAMMPKGKAIANAIRTATTANSAVCGKTSAIRDETGFLWSRQDTPRVPESTSRPNAASCPEIGLSKSRQARRAARSASVAWSPSMASTGSPGTARRIKNTARATPTMANRAPPMRRRKRSDQVPWLVN